VQKVGSILEFLNLEWYWNSMPESLLNIRVWIIISFLLCILFVFEFSFKFHKIQFSGLRINLLTLVIGVLECLSSKCICQMSWNVDLLLHWAQSSSCFSPSTTELKETGALCSCLELQNDLHGVSKCMHGCVFLSVKWKIKYHYAADILVSK